MFATVLDFRQHRRCPRPKDYRPLVYLFSFLGISLVLLNGLRDPGIQRWLGQAADAQQNQNGPKAVAPKKQVAPSAPSTTLAAAETTVRLAGPAGSREFFRTLGIDDAFFNQLADGEPVSLRETDPLLRILFRLRRFTPLQTERWALSQDKLNAGSMRELRGEIIRLRGRVVSVEPRRPPEDVAERYEMPEYFRCRMQLASSAVTAEIYTEHVPPSWKKGAVPNAAGSALGVFLKSVLPAADLPASDANPPTLVFVAPRVAWYTDDLLGKLGMDFGLLEELRNQPREQWISLQSEPFYQLLAAVGRAEPGQLMRQAVADLPNCPKDRRWTMYDGEERYAVAPLFNKPDEQTGRLVALKGSARLIKEVRVEDPDIIARFGINHYYQVSLFTDDSLEYDEKTNTTQSNPVTFCVRELPPGMPYGEIPGYGETLYAAGFFLKKWRYVVPKMTDPALNPADRQSSPLLIGRTLTWLPAPKPSPASSYAFVIGAAAIFFLAIIWFTAWQFRRQEKRWLEQEPEDLDFAQIARMDKKKRPGK